MDILLWWALFSCITFLCCTHFIRYGDGLEIEEYGRDDWVTVILFSTFFPIGWIVLFCKYVWPLLIKKRRN